MPPRSEDQYHARKAERARQRKDASRKPWWWFGISDPVARFTGGLAILTLALCGVATLQWAAMRDQLDVMQGQLDEMKAEHRPWVSVKADLVREPKDGPLGLTGAVTITTKNTGTAPAFSIFPLAFLYPYGYRVDGISIVRAAKVYRRVCRNMPPRDGAGYDLFPGEEKLGAGKDQPHYAVQVPPEDDIPNNWPADGFGHYFSGYVAVCIKYTSGADETSHTSLVVYSVIKPKLADKAIWMLEGSFAD